MGKKKCQEPFLNWFLTPFQPPGNAARDYIARGRPTEQVRFTRTLKIRRIDVLAADGRLAIEVKVGLTGLGKRGSRIRTELARDIQLLRAGGPIEEIAWVFVKSKKTGLVGPRAALLKKLQDNGIQVVITEFLDS